MKNYIARISIVVRDYDEAIDFYTRVLDFDLIEDSKISDQKRWVIVAPKGASACGLLLAKADDEEQLSRVGNQTGGRVFLFLYTSDFKIYFQKLCANGVKIIRQPLKEEYGTVAVFADLYGNLWDLIEPATKNLSTET